MRRPLYQINHWPPVFSPFFLIRLEAIVYVNMRPVALAFALTFAHTGCGDDPSTPSAPDSSGPLPAGGGLRWDPLDPIMLWPPSNDDFVVQVGPFTSAEQIEQIATDLGLEVKTIFPFGDGQIVLYDGPDEEIPPFADYAFVKTYSPNIELDINAEGISLTIGFIGWEWLEEGIRGQNAFETLQLEVVHEVATGEGVKIGVIDTGANGQHPGLAGHVEVLPPGSDMRSGECPKNYLDDDNDGYTDEGWGHGTFVAGEIAICAPGATIVPVRVLNSEGYGSLVDVIHGIELAVAQGCTIINLSLCLSGTSSQFTAIMQELKQNGIAVVAAAGNAGGHAPLFPGTSPHAFGVAAVDDTDTLAWFSGGGNRIDLGAPGIDVYSAWVEGGTAKAMGTSMAAPIISSAIALAMEAHGMTPLGAIAHLRLKARPIHPAPATNSGVLALRQSMDYP